MEQHEELNRAYSIECDHLRCACGSLLARIVAGGVELKCRRCKRAVVIPFAKPEDTDDPAEDAR